MMFKKKHFEMFQFRKYVIHIVSTNRRNFPRTLQTKEFWNVLWKFLRPNYLQILNPSLSSKWSLVGSFIRDFFWICIVWLISLREQSYKTDAKYVLYEASYEARLSRKNRLQSSILSKWRYQWLLSQLDLEIAIWAKWACQNQRKIRP